MLLLTLVMILVVCSVTFLTYLPSLECDLVFDDHLAIRNNMDVSNHSHSIFASDGLFFNDFWGKNLRDIASHKSYRPLTILTFRLNHWYHEFNAWGFHLVNVLGHCVVSMLVVVLGLFLFKNDFGEESGRCLMAAALSGLLFGVHPVHVEAVTGVVGRAEIMGGMFVILAFLCGSVGIHAKSLFSKITWHLSMTLLYLLATLSKETGTTVLPILGVYDLLYYVRPILLSPNPSRPGLVDKVKGLVPFLFRTVTLLVGLVAYFALRVTLMSSEYRLTDATLETSQLIRKTENPLVFVNGTFRYLSMNYIQAYYARLLVYPYDLCAEYSFNCIPMIESFSDPRNAATVLVYTILLVFIILSLYYGKWSLLMCVSWLIFPHLPASHFLVTIGTLVAERTLYVPSIGFCLLVGWLTAYCPVWFGNKSPLKQKEYQKQQQPKPQQSEQIQQSKKNPPLGKPTHQNYTNEKVNLIVLAIFGIVLVMFMNGTYHRSEQWKSEDTLFLSAGPPKTKDTYPSPFLVQSCPNSAKMHQQLAQVYENRGNMPLAYHHYTVARQIDPDWCDLDFCFGKYYLSKLDLAMAIPLLKKNLHCIYTNMKSYNFLDLLMEVYKLYFSMNQGNITAHYEYAEIMELVEHKDMAAIHFRESGVLALNSHQYDQAQKSFTAALSVQPKQCDIYYWQGKLYLALDKLQEASKTFRKGLDCKGNDELNAMGACASELYTIITNNSTIFTPAEFVETVEILKQVVKKLGLSNKN